MGTLQGNREERPQHPSWKAPGNLTEILWSKMKDFVMAVEDKAVKHRLHHGVSQGHMPTKAWSKSTMSTFCLTSLGCFPTWQKEKMPTSCSNKAVVAITAYASLQLQRHFQVH